MKSILYTALMAVVAFTAPIHSLVYGVLFLVGVDLVLGIWRAKRNGLPIKSKELKATLVKLFLYELLVLVAFVIDTVFIPGNFIVRTASAGIALVELKSIAENVANLTGFNLWALVKDKLKEAASASTKD